MPPSRPISPGVWPFRAFHTKTHTFVAQGVIGGCPQKYNGGRIDIQLTFSRNGRHWQRTLRDPFLPNTWGSVMSGVVTPTSVLRLDNGTTLILASATRWVGLLSLAL